MHITTYNIALIIFNYYRAAGRDHGFLLIKNNGIDMWIAMAVAPFISYLIGIIVNAYDDVSYRRYMLFLRLEFDTRLGMHSPR
jgi:hypothetical protein